jgi:predicted DNA-binding protein
MDNLDKKIGDDSSAKKEFLEVLVNKISKTKVSTKVKPIIEYLLEQLENQITLLYIDSLID